jgi:hypothetical protein
MNKDPLGAQGDFITSPEISPMFGEVSLFVKHMICSVPHPILLLTSASCWESGLFIHGEQQEAPRVCAWSSLGPAVAH